MRGPFGEKIVFKNKIKEDDFKKKSLFFFIDHKLKDKIDAQVTKDSTVKYLNGGENLKTFDQFKKNLNFLFSKKADKKTTIVAIGGGSLLDSIGFLASTFLRGVDLILIPTTWLSCVDASVGGKTALNWDDKKNQVGSFYPPKSIMYYEDLIHKASIKEAQGEILKTLFLNHNAKWAKVYLKDGRVSFESLKNFVRYKTKIVKKDPYEKKGIRTILNLGHTLAHAIELKNKLSHGESVIYGLKFSLEWSFYKKLISEKKYKSLKKLLPNRSLKELNLTAKDLREILKFDKKREGDKLNFVFLSADGARASKINVEDLIAEFMRQAND